MKTKGLPLEEMSIEEVYNSDEATYEIPIYQRNFAWGKDEIFTLVQDVYDAYKNDKNSVYYIGTLVTYDKGDKIYEVIDGQQRLTAIYLMLIALKNYPHNKLTYRARTKANKTIEAFKKLENPLNLELNLNNNEKDYGIIEGFKYVNRAIEEIVPHDDQGGFKGYFIGKVHLIRYHVPKDTDLNHYFEIMNSRGEQLEKHEIVKAKLIGILSEKSDKAKFNSIWEACSEMNVYIQQKYRDPEKKDHDTEIFGKNLSDFKISKFEDLLEIEHKEAGKKKISELLKNVGNQPKEKDKPDTFQPIIDFSNFLLIVLKLTRINEEKNFIPTNFTLDDKELIHEFDKVEVNEEFVKRFGFNLLKAKYLLDNYIVHHSKEDDTISSNPWKLQHWYKDNSNEYPKNFDNNDKQYKLVQLLSMFEVTFAARQRKNYLFYCLLYLFREDQDISKYYKFVSRLADKYFYDIYLNKDSLNENNTPKPGIFDSTILDENNQLNVKPTYIKKEKGFKKKKEYFNNIYGDCNSESKPIPLFIFNYLDYKLWEKYANELRGKNKKEGDRERTEFFDSLGCRDFELKPFDQFYFSRTRMSLEHFYPQALAKDKYGKGILTQKQINNFGNYAMIGSAANSSGSNLTPKTKIDYYLDDSRKINQVSVASLKFRIMMQKCKDNQRNQSSRASGEEWNFDDIKDHRDKMLNIMFEV